MDLLYSVPLLHGVRKSRKSSKQDDNDKESSGEKKNTSEVVVPKVKLDLLPRIERRET